MSGVQVSPSKVDLGRKVDPRDSFVLNCKVAPRRLTHSGTGVLKGERLGASTGGRWRLDRECPREDGRAVPRCPSTGGPWGHREEGGNEQI